jgi:hypothetical protein
VTFWLRPKRRRNPSQQNAAVRTLLEKPRRRVNQAKTEGMNTSPAIIQGETADLPFAEAIAVG